MRTTRRKDRTKWKKIRRTIRKKSRIAAFGMTARTSMNNQTPYGWLKEFCEKNELPFYGLHSFRHFAASALISAGLDVVTVSGALGHANSGTTLNTYSHMFQTAQARVSSAMDFAFGFLNKEEKQEKKGA